MTPDERALDLAKLRERFPDSAIGKMPRGGIQLDYVGHANVTARLLDVDPEWTWEPLATNEYGLPIFDYTQNGQPVGLWIKLTVCGHTRLGYGSVQAGAFDAVKQLIGDAIRNAAMRFGVALDLWSKEELVSDSAGTASHASATSPAAPPKNAGGGADGADNSPKQAAASPAPSPTQSQAQEDASHNKENEPEGAPVGNSVPPGSESWVAIKQAVESGALKQTSVHIHAATLCTGRDGVSVPSRFEDVKDCPDDILAAVADHFKVGVAA
jgi:hypothetical protein